MFVSEIPTALHNGPPSSLNYKRAILRSAPREFTVEVLSPTKHGGKYSFGLKICAIIRSSSNGSDRQSVSSRSTSSHSEYEIWRRWEDCLDFQVTLEEEYAALSRQKVKVLRRAALAKKKGNNETLYNVAKLAASFDSLPDGPDPREVALDVHEFVPALSRKGTLFRVSQATVEQRGREWAAFINGLFNPDPEAPILLQELRNTQSVRDFFGYWRRDQELAEKAGKDVNNKSLSSTRSTMSFSSSYTYNTQTISSETSSMASPTRMSSISSFGSMSPSKSAHLRRSASAQMASTQRLESNRQSYNTLASAPPHAADRRFIPDSPLSITFTDELLLHDEREPVCQASPIHATPGVRPLTEYPPSPIVASRTRYPSRPPESPRGHLSRNPSVPHPIPEEEPMPTGRPIPRTRSNNALALPDHRKGRVFDGPSALSIGTSIDNGENNDPVALPDAPPAHDNPIVPSTPTRSQSSRRQSSLLSPSSARSIVTSVSSRFSNLSIARSSVTSISSISSFFGASSKKNFPTHADDNCESDNEKDLRAASHDMYERGPPPVNTPDAPSDPWRNSVASFSSMRTDASADGVLPQRLRQWLNLPHNPSLRSGDARDSQVQIVDAEDLVDPYYTNPDDPPSECIKFSMDTLENKNRPPPLYRDDKRYSLSSNSSNTHSGSHATTTTASNHVFAIKAAYHDHVVVFRVNDDMSLAMLRQRVQERFELHESVPVKDNFLLAYVPSNRTSSSAPIPNKPRANFVTSPVSDLSQLRLLQAEDDWQAATMASNGKLTLRVLDP